MKQIRCYIDCSVDEYYVTRVTAYLGRCLCGLQREHLIIRLLQLRIQRDNRHTTLMHLCGGDGQTQSNESRIGVKIEVEESVFHIIS